MECFTESTVTLTVGNFYYIFYLYMEKEEIAILKRISETLDKMYETMPKPQSKLDKVFNGALTAVGLLGILAIIDVILSWLRG